MKYIYHILFLLIITSCHNNKKEMVIPSEIKHIYTTNSVLSSINSSKLFTIKKVIPISLNGFDIIGVPKKIINSGDNVFVYSTMPSLLSKIDSIGNIVNQIVPNDGPNTIKGINEFRIFEGFIYVLARNFKLIYKLDLNLKFISKIKLDFYCQSFEIIDDNMFILYLGKERSDKTDTEFIIFDANKQEIILKQILIDPNIARYFKILSNNHIVKNSDNTYLLLSSTTDTVFKLKNNFEIVPKYLIDYGSSRLPSRFYETSKFKNVFEFLTKVRKTNYALRHHNIESNDIFLKIVFEQSGEFITTLYNKKNNSSISLKMIKDDIVSNIEIEARKTLVNLHSKNEFISYYSFEQLDPIEGEKYYEIVNKAKSENKDILIFGELKNINNYDR